MRSRILTAIACALTVALSSGIPASAQSGQQIAPPEVFAPVDGRGVDLARGVFRSPTPTITIGDPGAGGMSYTRSFMGAGWRDVFQGTLNSTGSAYVVTLGTLSQTFTESGGSFTSDQGSGATLVSSGSTYVYTASNGTVAVFDPSLGTAQGLAAKNGVVTSITYPDGEVRTFHYITVWVDKFPGSWVQLPARRLQSVTNNRGYQAHFSYALDDPMNNGQVPYFRLLERVTLINNAVDYCGPTSFYCSGGPTLDFTATSVTDTLGRTTTYSYNAYGQIATVTPSEPTSGAITVAYNGDHRVSSVTQAGATWSYTYADSAGTRTTTMTSPLSQVTEVESSLTTGLVSAVENALGKRTTYTYDSDDRVTRVTAPQGNYTNYTYDSRGNVTAVLQAAKPSSSLVDIVTSATYPASCSNPRTCNQPTSVTDAAGNVTNFTYDATHGGMLTATAPAPSGSGDRPQTRITYAPLYAWYKRTSGTIIQAASPVYLPIQSSTCSSGTATAGCINTANEQRTIVNYGATGVANNLLPVSATVQAGNGTLAATTTLAYDDVGNLLTVDGPLAGTADTTRYRYDDGRQMIGQVGPDPDGGSSLAHPAQRTTYNLNGQPTRVEFGTVTSQSDAAWAAFALIDKQEMVYDAAGRTTQARLIAGASSVQAMIQYSYDAAGRIDCVAQRMNATTWASPPSSACTLAATGSYGPDRITRTTYDAVGRVATTTSAFGTTAAIVEATRAYNNNGQLISLTDGEGNRTQYQRDGFDRLASIEYPHPTTPGSNTGSDDEIYVYDAAGRLANRRVRTDQRFYYTYDNLGRVTHVNAPGADPDEDYTYDLLGRVLSVTAGSQSMSNVYDAIGRLTSQTGNDGAVSYQYDSAGRRTRMTWPDAFYVTYSYQVNGAVTAIRENGATSGIGVLASFTYDNQGRRTAITRGNGVTTAYAFDAASRLSSLTQNLPGTSSDLTASFSYNPAGQIASRTASNDAYAWTGHVNLDLLYGINGLNQITSVSGQSAPVYDGRGNMISDGTRTFGYDYNNRLSSVSGGVGLVYDPAGRLATLTGTSATVRFQYDGVDMIAEYNTSGALQDRYVHGPGTDEPLVHYTGSGTTSREWLIADERGSIIALTNASGTATVTNSYDEYGLPGASNSGRYGYTGQVWLEETGLYHYKNRVYHPGLGRFMQTDPIGQAGGMNIYAYVGGDPVNRNDPLGLVDVITITYRPTCATGAFCGQDAIDLLERLQGGGMRGELGDFQFGGVGGGPASPHGNSNSTQCTQLTTAASGVQPSGAPNVDDVLDSVGSVDRAMRSARTPALTGPREGLMFMWFRNGGRFDIKTLFRGPGNAWNPDADAYGNFLYGAVGRELGITRLELDLAAGMMQDGRPVDGSLFPPIYPYGDHLDNANYSRMGQDYVDAGCGP
tara:strand:+ start:3317 stop:7534 length:4218 start_codon:yes stop_codon:yes gene_type:complete